MTKGFITVAAGDYYCKLATHLFMSYKLFGNCEYPFYVITDKSGAEKLNGVFDGVIIKNDFTKTSVDKICVFTDTPFDETIFIDADCSVVRDLNFAFELFEQNGSDVNAIAGIKELTGNKGIQFGEPAIKAFDLKYDYPNFNGGVYYYKKSETGKKCVDFMVNEIMPRYYEYHLLGFENGKIYDEPIVIVAMLKYGMKPLPIKSNIMVLVHNPKTVKWDIKNKQCKFKWYNWIASSAIIHWKVGGTETLIYEKYDAEVKGRYYNSGRIKILKNKLKAFVKYKIYPKLLKIFPRVKNIANKYKNAFK